MPRRQPLWWSTISSWLLTWLTVLLCLRDSPPSVLKPTRKTLLALQLILPAWQFNTAIYMQLYSKRIQYFYLHLCVKCIVNSVLCILYFHMFLVFSPQSLLNGMNSFLESLDITFRRDPNNFRPRINKLNSVKVSMYSIMLDVHCNILLTWRMSLLAIIIPSCNLLRRGQSITAVCVCMYVCLLQLRSRI